MPDWLQVIILGIIEGITEFLPISSTGHLLLAEQWLSETMFKDADARERFMVFIQSGAVLAVIAVFKERVRELITERRQTEVREYLIKMTVSFSITAVGGLVIKAAGWELSNDSALIAWALLIGGVMFIVIEQRNAKIKNEEKENKPLATISWTIVVAFGLAQLVAMVFPGASRSGATPEGCTKCINPKPEKTDLPQRAQRSLRKRSFFSVCSVPSVVKSLLKKTGIAPPATLLVGRTVRLP